MNRTRVRLPELPEGHEYQKDLPQRGENTTEEEVEDSVDATIDALMLAAPETAPLLWVAKHLFTWGIGKLWEAYDDAQYQKALDKLYKKGIWYHSRDLLPEPSHHPVPLSPSVDPESWTAEGMKRWKGKIVDELGNYVEPIEPLLPPLDLGLESSLRMRGWQYHYLERYPHLTIDRIVSKESLHSPKTYGPNVSYVPSGGFTTYSAGAILPSMR